MMARKNNLMHQETLQEEYEESKIKLIMANFAELEGKKLLEESETLNQDPFYLPIEKEQQQFIKRLNTHFILHNIQTVVKFILPTHWNRVAVLSLLVMSLLVATFTSVEALRVKVLNLFVQIKEEYTAIKLGEDSMQPSSSEEPRVEWDQAYMPTKILEGYQIIKVTNGENMRAIEYGNENNGFLIFQQHHGSSGVNADTENADEVLTLTINGHKGLFVRKKDMMTIVWQNEKQLFSIVGSFAGLNREQVIEMAESVSLIN